MSKNKKVAILDTDYNRLINIGETEENLVFDLKYVYQNKIYMLEKKITEKFVKSDKELYVLKEYAHSSMLSKTKNLYPLKIIKP